MHYTDKNTHGICVKSLSYASSMARATTSFSGRENAGGSCKSYIEGNVSQKRIHVLFSTSRTRTSTTAPRYLSADRPGNEGRKMLGVDIVSNVAVAAAAAVNAAMVSVCVDT